MEQKSKEEQKDNDIKKINITPEDVEYRQYKDENDIGLLMDMIASELSEPYSIYTYRYFVKNWPELTYLAFYQDKIIGVVIGKLDIHAKSERLRGYVAMIVVQKEYRGLKIGKKLTNMFIEKIREKGGEEIVLETEAINYGALGLYQRCGFAKVKRLMNYYLNGNDAYRLKLWLKPDQNDIEQQEKQQQNQIEEQKVEQA